MYTSLGLTGIVFIVHGLILYGWQTQNMRMALTWMIGMAAANLAGAAAFAARVGVAPHWRGWTDILSCGLHWLI
jgi:adiponectin receptor